MVIASYFAIFVFHLVGAENRIAAAFLRSKISSREVTQPGISELPGAANLSRSSTSVVKLKADYPFYHTTHELLDETQRLKNQCGGRLSVREEEKDGVKLNIIHLRDSKFMPVNKVFLLFGEHSRELIGPESALEFLRMLCGAGIDSQKRDSILNDSEFLLVMNANPRSRVKVENGEYCLRTNPDGVDLNRNWNIEWQTSPAVGSNTNPGSKPFSEPETKILKRLADEYLPSSFITVHSGTYGMYMPWAYSTDALAQKNKLGMLGILEKVDDVHCKCPFGAAGKEVGYPCPGTSLDYIYSQLNTSYSFAYEIYTDKVSADRSRVHERYEEKKVSMMQQRLTSKEVDSDGVSFLQTSVAIRSVASQQATAAAQAQAWSDLETGEDAEAGRCFSLFNPGTQREYNEVVSNWASAYIETADLIAKELRQKHASATR